MDLQCVAQRVGESVVLVATGLADLSTAPLLHASLRDLIDGHAGEAVMVNLDGLTGLDDAALGIVLGAAARARELGGDMTLVCSTVRVRQRLAANRLDELVHVAPSISAAERTGGYTAVIFTSERSEADADGYDAEARRMEQMARDQPGYVGFESARGDDGVGVTVSYWASAADARGWKRHSEHLIAQRAGRERWYRWYRVRIATVDREYSYDQEHVQHATDTAPS